MTNDKRLFIATEAMKALIGAPGARGWTKRQLIDNAIAYADMMLRRIGEIPADAQQRSEERMGSKNQRQHPKFGAQATEINL